MSYWVTGFSVYGVLGLRGFRSLVTRPKKQEGAIRPRRGLNNKALGRVPSEGKFPGFVICRAFVSEWDGKPRIVFERCNSLLVL